MLDFILKHWNDAFTLGVTLYIGYHQVQHLRSQPASFDIKDVNDAVYRDFEDFTRYEFEAILGNDGRDPVSIHDAGLEIDGESVEVSTNIVDGPANLPQPDFNKIKLGSFDYDTFDLHGIGDPVSTTDPLTGVFWMDSSDERVDTEVTFDRAQ